MASVVWLFLAGLALMGCAPTSKPVLLSGQAKESQNRKWEKYGAYYIIDEFFLETSAVPGLVSSPTNKYIINKKIKILTADGARYGTVEVPVYGFFTSDFRISQWDSTGKKIPLVSESIRTEYLKKGKIIFPNVTPGSVLEIYIEFTTNTLVTTLEHWFSGPIPVAEGRFTFSYLNEYGYAFKSYGPVDTGLTERDPGASALHYKTWEVKDVFPRSKVDFQDDIDATEPRLALAIRQFQLQRIYESWEKISEQYETYVLKASFFQSTSKLKKLVDSLKQEKTTDLGRASVVFAWVQKNISFKSSSLSPINPDKVVTGGQGNMWEMAVVMREMFKHLGLETDVLVTRPRSYGGFDSSFVSPAQLAVTLVTVKIGRKTYLAFPWSAGAALGEFPLDFFGLQALSLVDKESVSLPDFVGDSSYSQNVFHVHPEDENATMDMEMESGGYLSYSIRNSLMNQRDKDIEEAYQKALTNLGRSNSLMKCKVQGIDHPGKPVTAKLVVSNPNQTVKHKGEIQMRLSHVFFPFFTSYDTTRSSGFKNNIELFFSETVHVPKIIGKKLTPTFICRDLSNALFQVTCTTEDAPAEFVFTRRVKVNRKKFNALEIRSLAGDIQMLNRINESNLLWKSDQAELPATLLGKKRKKG